MERLCDSVTFVFALWWGHHVLSVWIGLIGCVEFAWEWRMTTGTPGLDFCRFPTVLFSAQPSNPLPAIFPSKFSLSLLPYLGNIFHLAGTSYSMENNHTFLYFAYGSNLLKERLQLKNPSAIVHCVASLKVTSTRRIWRRAASPRTFSSVSYTYLIFQDYKLVFGNYNGLASDRWHGGVATIEHSPGDEVWGVVWKMNISDLESLDEYCFITIFLNCFP